MLVYDDMGAPRPEAEETDGEKKDGCRLYRRRRDVGGKSPDCLRGRRGGYVRSYFPHMRIGGPFLS